MDNLRLLLIPIHADALFLSSNRMLAEAVVDFSRLPYRAGRKTANPGAPYISESIAVQPFQNRNLRRKSGLHLHWALPDSLTRGTHTDEGVSFPAVPDRWLVVRKWPGKPSKHWVVESDYFYPLESEIAEDEGFKERFQSIAFPVKAGDEAGQPFRYMGRQMPLEEWQNRRSENDEYLPELTAAGYGEPTFHAYFPNCHSVFGFYDEEVKEFPDHEISYFVFGCYSDPGKDFLARVVAQFPTAMEALDDLIEEHQLDVPVEVDKGEFLQRYSGAQGEELWEHLIEKGWLTLENGSAGPARIATRRQRAEPDLEDPFYPEQQDIEAVLEILVKEKLPGRMVCFANLTFHPQREMEELVQKIAKIDADLENAANDQETAELLEERNKAVARLDHLQHIDERPFDHNFTPPSITLGDTGLEALSSYLANVISDDPEDRKKIEDQLESLHLSERLDSLTIDLGPRFREARHESGFNSVGGGWLWTIALQSPDGREADAKDTEENIPVELPENIALLLNNLNQEQQRYDSSLFDIASMRTQLFADWFKYMLTVYPPANALDDYPDADEVKYVIEQRFFGDEIVQVTPEILPELDGRILAQDIMYEKIIARELTPLLEEHLEDIAGARIQNIIFLKEERLPFNRNSAPDTIGRMLARDVLHPQTGAVLLGGFSRIAQPHTISFLEAKVAAIDVLSESAPLAAEQNLPHLVGRILSKEVVDKNSGAIILPPFTRLERKHLPMILASGARNISHFVEEKVKVARANLSDFLGRLLALNLTDPRIPERIEGAERLSRLDLTEALAQEIIFKRVKYIALLKEDQDSLLRKMYDTVGTLLFEQLGGDMAGLQQALEHSQNPQCQGQKVIDAFSALKAELDAVNDHEKLKEAGLTYILKQAPGPRYWEPREPVVLLTGDIATPSDRYGSDGLLPCRPVPFPGAEPLPELLSAPGRLDELVGEVENLLQEETFALARRRWTRQPWNPLWLEWEIQMDPLELKGNLANKETGNFDPSFIDTHFRLELNEPDLLPKEDAPVYYPAANVYSGRCLLTSHAGSLMKEQTNTFLVKKLLPLYLEDKNLPLASGTEEFLLDDFEDIKAWFENSDQEKSHDNPLYTALKAKEQIDGLNALSQSIGGANPAFLQMKQTFQLPIADPLGFSDYRPFTAIVNALVGESTRLAPQPLKEFNPIRSGKLKILSLRLVDSFGQTIDVSDTEAFFTSSHFTDANAAPGGRAVDQIEIKLSPRLMQPARLNFRWLSAMSGLEEMNDHPASSPICGWVMANNLDNSLAVYDQRGHALGSVNLRAQWTPVPGQADPVELSEFADPHLRKMVEYLIERGEGFLQNFLTVIDSAMRNINPERFDKQQAMALLVGRPMALVRASVNLQLKGRPAVDQGWEAFRLDRERAERQTDGYTKVKFPIRIGEHQQFNDGLIGYWRETPDGDYEGNIFYSIQGDETPGGNEELIVTRDEENIQLHQSIDDDPQVLTMLVDPAGVVHATCGILPAKSIDIPDTQYMDALKAIEVTFLSAPLISDGRRVELSLPVNADYDWSWLERRNGHWETVTPRASLLRSDLRRGLAETIWEEFRKKGWILEENEQWIVADTENRLPLDPDLTGAVGVLAEILGEPSAGNPKPPISLEQLEAKIEDEGNLLEAVWTGLHEAPNVMPVDESPGGGVVSWLKPSGEPGKAMITPRDDRSPGSYLVEGILLDRIADHIFDLYAEAIVPMEPNALFEGRGHVIREGWLKLGKGKV